jgi:hypothetical protein
MYSKQQTPYIFIDDEDFIDGLNLTKLESQRAVDIELCQSTILNSTIVNFQASQGDGGAVQVYNSNLTVEASHFKDNLAETGGAIVLLCSKCKLPITNYCSYVLHIQDY